MIDQIFVAKNLLPVLAENDYLLMIRELKNEFSEFKRQMFRFDCNDNLKIYFRCKQKIWKWALKHYLCLDIKHFNTHSNKGTKASVRLNENGYFILITYY